MRAEKTGARWIMRSLAGMGDKGNRDIRSRTLTQAMLELQKTGKPVHEWETCELGDAADPRQGYRTVQQYMTTDLFTVRPEDLVDLAASLMDWEHVRHVPVEDDEGRLVGVVSHRSLLRLIAQGNVGSSSEPVAVRNIMKTDVVTVSPETSTLEAMSIMRESKVGCLPVIDKGRLVGIITDHDLIVVASSLLERYLQED